MSDTATHDKIIQASANAFATHGFDGASISQIAKQAGINQSLIYHYFKSKEDLWVSVKKHCVNAALNEVQKIRHDSLKHFLEDLIEARFSVYEQHMMRQLVHWQALNAEPSKFYGSKATPHPVFDIAPQVKKLQEKGLIRSDMDYKVLSGVIFSLVGYAYLDYAAAFKHTKKHKESYRKAAYDMLLGFLSGR